MELILPTSIFSALAVAVAIIVLDTLFGVINAIKEHKFDIAKFPQFLAKNILPYCGGLFLLGLVAHFMEADWTRYVFYICTVPVVAKFVGDLIDKIKATLGVNIDVDIEVKPPKNSP